MATVKGNISFSVILISKTVSFVSANSGAQWCFVEAGTPCQDLQTSDTKDWSYEACATPIVC